MALSTTAEFAKNGVVWIKNVLDSSALVAADDPYNWSIDNPGPHAQNFETGGARFYQDISNPHVVDGYSKFLMQPVVFAIARLVWGQQSRVWFMHEQVFLKEGGESRRTPWHQDSTYLAVAGDMLAVLWICLDPLDRNDTLEFVRGSHKGPTYNGCAFRVGDDTAPTFDTSELSRLPDIQGNRADWDIVISDRDMAPGDVIAFHPAILHGGAPVHTGSRRRSLTLRLFGDDVVYRPTPWRPRPMTVPTVLALGCPAA